MANARPPMFPVSLVHDILRRRGATDACTLVAEINAANTGPAFDDKKVRQRIHVLVHSGKIRAGLDPTNPMLRVYSLPETQPVRHKRVAQTPQPVAIVTPPVAQDAPEPELDTAPAPVIDLKGTVSAIADAVAKAIGSVLRARIEAVVQDQLQQALDSLPTQIAQVMVGPKGTVRNDPSQARVREPTAPKGPEKTRVTIVGLLAGQAQMIVKEYSDRLHLEFVEQAHTSGQRLKGLCHASEAVITMTGFISHATEDLIKSRGGNLVRVSGGMTSLRAELDKYVTEGGAA